MDAISKYLTISLGLIVLMLIIYCLMLTNDRDSALARLDRVNMQLNQVIAANVNLKGTIDLLEQQADQNRIYTQELERSKSETERNANKQLEQFKHVKRTNKTVNDWTSQPLPTGLY